MSTNRSKDRSSLCSFTFADGRQCRRVIPSAARDLLFAVVVAGLQTRQRDGRERPLSSRGQRSRIPTLSEGACFSPLHPKPCTSPSTNTSTPTAQIPGAKPSATISTSPPIPHPRHRNRLHLQLPRRHRTNLLPPSRTRDLYRVV